MSIKQVTNTTKHLGRNRIDLLEKSVKEAECDGVI